MDEVQEPINSGHWLWLSMVECIYFLIYVLSKILWSWEKSLSGDFYRSRRFEHPWMWTFFLMLLSVCVWVSLAPQQLDTLYFYSVFKFVSIISRCPMNMNIKKLGPIKHNCDLLENSSTILIVSKIWDHVLKQTFVGNVLRDVTIRPVTSSLIGPNILFSTLFWNTLSLCSSFNVRDQVSHPYKTAGKSIVFLCSNFYDFGLQTKRNKVLDWTVAKFLATIHLIFLLLFSLPLRPTFTLHEVIGKELPTE
jgi:hypothetical protein